MRKRPANPLLKAGRYLTAAVLGGELLAFAGSYYVYHQMNISRGQPIFIY